MADGKEREKKGKGKEVEECCPKGQGGCRTLALLLEPQISYKKIVQWPGMAVGFGLFDRCKLISHAGGDLPNLPWFLYIIMYNMYALYSGHCSLKLMFND